MKYMVWDNETETHHSHKRKANCFDPRNWIVMRGFKVQGDNRATMQHYLTKSAVEPIHIPDDVDIIVGHNVKFDLLYEMCVPGGREVLQAFYKRGGRIFCTQYAKYLKEGQQQKYQMCSMDSIIEEYGGRKKIDAIKALWEDGVLTSEIDPAMLEDYLIGTEEERRNSGDIGNTELIYLGLIKEIEELGMTEAVKLRMDGLAATTEMEFNGLKVDIATAREDLARLTAEHAEVSKELEQYIPALPEGLVFNWNSNAHKSCLIYGGTIKYEKSATYIDEKTGELARKKETAKWPLFNGTPIDPANLEWVEGTYCLVTGEKAYTGQDVFAGGKKKGMPKYRNVDVPGALKTKIQEFFFKLDGYTTPKDDWKLETKDGAGKPLYGTGSEIIEELAFRDIPFLKVMGRNDALNKEIGTYYVRVDPKKGMVGMLTCVMPDGHMLHHKLNHTSTITSRLSSSDPNMQNIPRGDKSRVKAMFVSRFGDEGKMAELDYSQLEVVVQGLLSRDLNLVRDLNNKIDFHCKRVALKNSVSYDFALFHCKNEDAPDYAKWSVERTGCKNFSFQRAYGAGATAIAASTGLGEQEVKDMITAEEKEYPGIVDFNNGVEKEVNATAEPFRDPERGWRTFRRGTWQGPTGTIYSWRSWDAPAFLKSRGITDTFSPPELKNYPVQGTGGELVQMVLGYLWRWFVNNDNFGGLAFLVNTVHDCVWADMHQSVIDTVVPGMKRIMEAIPHMLMKHFNIDCPVPFPVDAEIGDNMLDLHHYG